MIIEEIREKLFSLRDEGFASFQETLIPRESQEQAEASTPIIGVRTPALRAYAKELLKNEEIGQFLDTLPHTYFEENQLHAFILSALRGQLGDLRPDESEDLRETQE